MDYSACIQKAIDFIEENLFEDLRPATVASHIGFSEYHLHRIFCGMLTESVAEYIRKRRIFEIAKLLKTTDQTVQQLSSLGHFDSPEAFSRAFKKFYGVNPSQYRKSHKGWDFHKEKFTHEMLLHLKKGVTLTPAFKTFEEQTVVGLAASFDNERSEGVNNLWQQLLKRKDEIKDKLNGLALGVYLADHPEIKRKHNDTYVYLAGLPVTKVTELPPGMVCCVIPAKSYAVFTQSGLMENVVHSINYIWGTWIPNNLENYHHANAPDFELFGHRFDLEKQRGEFDHYVPITDVE